MKLNDVRKLAIRGQMRIAFELRNGMECRVTEHGLSKVPGLDNVADFNLEDEFTHASRFLLEPVAPAIAKGKTHPERREVNRAELETMVGGKSKVAEKDEE
jgi:hypothetical protein